MHLGISALSQQDGVVSILLQCLKVIKIWMGRNRIQQNQRKIVWLCVMDPIKPRDGKFTSLIQRVVLHSFRTGAHFWTSDRLPVLMKVGAVVRITLNNSILLTNCAHSDLEVPLMITHTRLFLKLLPATWKQVRVGQC